MKRYLYSLLFLITLSSHLKSMDHNDREQLFNRLGQEFAQIELFKNEAAIQVALNDHYFTNFLDYFNRGPAFALQTEVAIANYLFEKRGDPVHILSVMGDRNQSPLFSALIAGKVRLAELIIRNDNFPIDDDRILPILQIARSLAHELDLGIIEQLFIDLINAGEAVVAEEVVEAEVQKPQLKHKRKYPWKKHHQKVKNKWKLKKKNRSFKWRSR